MEILVLAGLVIANILLSCYMIAKITPKEPEVEESVDSDREMIVAFMKYHRQAISYEEAYEIITKYLKTAPIPNDIVDYFYDFRWEGEKRNER